MKYVVQSQSARGTWLDDAAFELFSRAVEYARHSLTTYAGEWRVVRRVDSVVMDATGVRGCA